MEESITKKTNQKIQEVLEHLYELFIVSDIPDFKKKEVSSYRDKSYEFLKALLEESFKYSKNKKPKYINCNNCKRLCFMSEQLHQLAHNLRNEFFLIPFLFDKYEIDDFDLAEALGILETNIKAKLKLLYNILREFSCSNIIVSLDLFTSSSNKTSDQLIKIRTIALKYVQIENKYKFEKKSSLSVDNPDIDNARKEKVDFLVIPQEEDRIKLIVPIRINSLISPTSKKDSIQLYNYTDVKDKLSSNAYEEYDLLGFVCAELPLLSSSSFNACISILKMFCDTIYKYIERFNHYRGGNFINKEVNYEKPTKKCSKQKKFL
jgi:hypothetical protein